MRPDPLPLVVDPPRLRTAAVLCSTSSAGCADVEPLVTATTLTSADVGPDGADLLASVDRFTARAAATLHRTAHALRDDADRLRDQAQAYVISDTVAAELLAAVAVAVPDGAIGP